MKHPNYQRYEKITEEYLKQLNLVETAKKFNITYERVRQIVNKMRIKTNAKLKRFSNCVICGRNLNKKIRGGIKKCHACLETIKPKRWRTVLYIDRCIDCNDKLEIGKRRKGRCPACYHAHKKFWRKK